MKTHTSKLSKVLATMLMAVILLSIAAPMASAYGTDNYADEQISLQWLAPQPTNHFSDVPDAPHWQNNPVSWAYRNNITTGVGGNRFNPNGRVTRETFATFLHRVAGQPAAGSAGFNDQGSIANWAAPAVNWASSVNVIQGFDGNVFRPQNNIQRQQIAAMLFRYAQSLGLSTTAPDGALANFPDRGNVGSWANESMRWAVHNGLITGVNGQLRPTNSATRAETVTMLERFVRTFNIPTPGGGGGGGTPPGGGGGTPPGGGGGAVGTHVLPRGTYVVGQDIPPGRYTVTAVRSATGRNSGNFVVRNPDAVWPAPGLIVNEILNSTWGEVRFGSLDLHGTPTVDVTLNVGYTVQVSGTDGFQFAPAVTPPANTLPTGRWIVGVHIAPGQYTATLTRPEMEVGGHLIINNANWSHASATTLAGRDAVSSVRVDLQAGQHIHVQFLHSVTFTP